MASRLGLPYLDMDRVLFQDDGALPIEQFRARVAETTDGPAWVADGNYHKLADVTWARSDVVVWLDYPLWFLYWCIARRAWRRMRGIEPRSARAGPRLFTRRNLVWVLTRKYFRKRPEYLCVLSQLERQSSVKLLRFRSPQRANGWLSKAISGCQAEAEVLLEYLARIQLEEQDGVLTTAQANQAAAEAVVRYMHRQRLTRARPGPS